MPESTTKSRILVSVVIPVRNVELFIRGAIDSVIANDFPREFYEILVVDNGSTDRTIEIARDLGATILTCAGTISATRNVGVQSASGEVIAFLDSDCLAAPNWLRAGYSRVAAEDCVAGYFYDVPEGARWIETDWFAQRDPGLTRASSLCGGNIFVRRSTFLRLNGFDEGLVTGEDAEFCLRASQSVPVLSDDLIRVIHLGNPKTLRQFLRREIWYGLGALGSFRLSLWDKPFLGTLAFAAGMVLGFVGLVRILFGGATELFALGAMLQFAVLVATLVYRRRHINSALQAVRLGFLYSIYYFGRTIALLYALAGKNSYHGIKESPRSRPADSVPHLGASSGLGDSETK